MLGVSVSRRMHIRMRMAITKAMNTHWKSQQNGISCLQVSIGVFILHIRLNSRLPPVLICLEAILLPAVYALAFERRRISGCHLVPLKTIC